jgi:EpsI family protein
MITLTFSAVIYAELFRRSHLQMWTLLLIAPLLGVFVNVVRVVTIVLNPYSEFSAIHTAQGIGMVIVGVLLLAGVDRLLAGLFGERAYTQPRRRAEKLPDRVGRSRFRLAAVIALLLSIGALPHLVARWRPALTIDPSIYRMPPRAGDWTSESAAVDKRFLGSVGFTERSARTYENGDARVDLFLGLNRRLEREGSMLSEKTMLPGAGWRITERGRVALAPDGREATYAIVEFRGHEEYVVHWYEGMSSLPVETVRALFALDQSPMRRDGYALVVRASTRLTEGPTSRDDARARIEALLPHVRRQLEAL